MCSVVVPPGPGLGTTALDHLLYGFKRHFCQCPTPEKAFWTLLLSP